MGPEYWQPGFFKRSEVWTPVSEWFVRVLLRGISGFRTRGPDHGIDFGIEAGYPRDPQGYRSGSGSVGAVLLHEFCCTSATVLS